MEKRLYEKLIERAKYFLEIAKEDLKNKKYDVGMFHVEQCIQLLLKAYLLKNFGDFPKTHDLFILFEQIKEEKVKKLVEEKWYIIEILIDAYISSRYFAREYREKELVEAINFAEELIKCLNI